MYVFWSLDNFDQFRLDFTHNHSMHSITWFQAYLITFCLTTRFMYFLLDSFFCSSSHVEWYWSSLSCWSLVVVLDAVVLVGSKVFALLKIFCIGGWNSLFKLWYFWSWMVSGCLWTAYFQDSFRTGLQETCLINKN